MALTSGTRIGPYEIVGSLGAGGMGEVYRAHDAKLGRDVALKLLPAAFASDPERLARFDREAQVLASLNHPHIAQIYGFEESGDTRALVMELVDGPTLADLIVTGAMEVPEALRIARQIALALEAAHERGITHRDLKPSNVKVAADGSVKVLDFGLAKLSSHSDSSPRSTIDVTASPTLMSSTLATSVGVILGTAAYMSPEQARGRIVDKRSDIWAFGCVLYEMLTGRRAFKGEEISDTLAAILRDEPDWSLIPSTVSPTVRRYLQRCLAKDPSQRVHDIADLRLALEGAFDAPNESGPASTSLRPTRALYVAAALAVAVAGAVLGALGMRAFVPDTAPSIVQLFASPSTALLAPTLGDPDVAISSDGSRIAYVSFRQSGLELFVRSIDRLDPVRLEGVENPRSPFFSPDGNWVGYFDQQALKKVSVSGGPAVTITAVTGNGRGASWGPDDTIVFATADSTGLMRVSASGGTPAALTTPNKGEDHTAPQILPGGRAVLFTINSARLVSNSQLAVLDLATGAAKPILSGASHGRYTESGHLVYGAGGVLRAVGFDLDAMRVRGSPVPVAERVLTKNSGMANFDVASNGTLVYEAGDSAVLLQERSLVWVDRQGREEAIPAPKRAYIYPRISPDGTRVALDIRDQENDIWIWDLARQTLSRLTFDPGFNRGAVWTPDGKRIVFAIERDGDESLYWQAADGSGAPERLSTAQSGRQQFPMSMSRDGTRLVFSEPGQPPFDLLMLTLADKKSESLLNSRFSEANGEVSPDGRWLAYQSDETGMPEVYVRPFPNGSGRWQVSSAGGNRPAWASSGRELFYLQNDGPMMAVPILTGATGAFTFGTPQRLFDSRYSLVQSGRTYDVTKDAKRFLMVKTDRLDPGLPPTQLVVVLNWTQELKRLVPNK